MKHLYLISILLLFSCRGNNGNSDNNRKLDFRDYYSKLEEIKTPVKFTCGKIQSSYRNDSLFVYERNQIDSNLLEMFYPYPTVCCGFYGRIFKNEKFIAIIYRVDAENTFPYLFTYNESGKIIDSLLLSNGNCNQDFWLLRESYTTEIESNMTITLRDTIINYKGNWEYADSLKKDYMIVKTNKYLLSEKGEVRKEYEKLDSIKFDE